MNWEYISCVAVLAAAVSILASVRAVRRVKKQIAEMTEIMEEVRTGNGNRRILTVSSELTAPLAYAFNETVSSYEAQLASYRRMEEANKQLMTSLSHDVRTPLTTLIGYLDAVHRGIVEEKEKEEYIETARRKAYDLKEYIDMLFDWFKLGSDEFAMHIAPVEAAELTRDILVDWIPILEERQIAYTIRIPEEPCWVELDTDGYIRIWNNLLQNILSHSQADRILLEVSKQEGKMKLKLSDNGIGIEKEDLKHIFERLYKCDRGRTEKGSGLGLSIVRQLTERMKGSIDAESAPGTGTAFTLYFPLMQG